MRTRVGLWIDRRKAVIVSVTEKGEQVRQIRSGVERQLRPHGGARAKGAYGPQDAPPDDKREREFMGHLNVFYDKVASSVRGAQSILVMGPGEAKGELSRRIERGRPRRRVVGVETSDKMSERQVAAEVRRFYHLQGRKPRLKRRGGTFLRGRAG